ncbi:MAG TPA: formate hydrogenlyase [Rhodospirillaceae bacterium]|nr:MAG: formate hydrogenlyase [Alphaproteobacteria bacterium GWF2_58_20]HAU29765.1 formate hydrogenlyase [Rhodospirillaceae bacterium]
MEISILSITLKTLLQVLQAFLVLAVAPLLTGWVRMVKARMLGRTAPSLFQPWRDIFRLLRKETIVAPSASRLFTMAPTIIFVTTWIAASLVPTVMVKLPLAPVADIIALIGLLGLSRFFLVLAGLDIGTSFGGLGASREAFISSLAEPAMMLVIFALATLAGSTDLPTIATYMAGSGGMRLSLLFAFIAFLMVAVAENARIPVDNPTTHLELTMVHEAMILEYSGHHLALIELAAALKLLLYIGLAACLFLPWGMALPGQAFPYGFAAWGAKLLLGGAALAALETGRAKMRVFRVPEFLGGALLLAFIGLLLAGV